MRQIGNHRRAQWRACAFRTRERGDSSMTKSSIRSRCISAAAMMVGLGLSTQACGSGRAPTGDDAASTGSIELALTAGPVVLSTVEYTIENFAGFYKAGTFDVSSSTSLVAIIGGIPAGTDYFIQLTAASTLANGGSAHCAGSAVADVLGGPTTATDVRLSCKLASQTGSVKIHGTVNLCPTIS